MPWWDLEPYALFTPAAVSYPGSSRPSASVFACLAQKVAPHGLGLAGRWPLALATLITLAQPLPPEREDSLWRGEIKNSASAHGKPAQLRPGTSADHRHRYRRALATSRARSMT